MQELFTHLCSTFNGILSKQSLKLWQNVDDSLHTTVYGDLITYQCQNFDVSLDILCQ